MDSFTAADAMGTVPPEWQNPGKASIGKSLMNPQALADRVLPADMCETLHRSTSEGVPTDCGPDWPEEVKKEAATAGPQTSVLSPENVQHIWDDVRYQERDGFI